MSMDAYNYVLSPHSSCERAMLSVVIPTYNEKENVGMIVSAIADDLRVCGIAHEIIVVDDDSPDFTWKRAQELTTRYPQLRVIRREEERGLGSAAMRGWQAARGEYLGLIDADGQHPPENLSRLYRKLTAAQPTPDIAIASRHIEDGSVGEWSRMRSWVSSASLAYGRAILPEVLRYVTDSMSGCFIVHRDAITNIPIKVQGFKILLEILSVGNISSITEIGYTFRARDKGESKASAKEMIRYLIQVWRLRFYRWSKKPLAQQTITRV